MGDMQSRMTWRCNGSTVGVEYGTACILINHNDGAFLFTFKDKDTLTTAVPKRCDNTQPSTSWLIFHPQSRRPPSALFTRRSSLLSPLLLQGSCSLRPPSTSSPASPWKPSATPAATSCSAYRTTAVRLACVASRRVA